MPLRLELHQFFSQPPRHRGRAHWPDMLLTAGRGYAAWFRDAGVSRAPRSSGRGPLREHGWRSRSRANLRFSVVRGSSLTKPSSSPSRRPRRPRMSDIPLIINFHPVTDEAWRDQPARSGGTDRRCAREPRHLFGTADARAAGERRRGPLHDIGGLLRGGHRRAVARSMSVAISSSTTISFPNDIAVRVAVRLTNCAI